MYGPVMSRLIIIREMATFIVQRRWSIFLLELKISVKLQKKRPSINGLVFLSNGFGFRKIFVEPCAFILQRMQKRRGVVHDKADEAEKGSQYCQKQDDDKHDQNKHQPFGDSDSPSRCHAPSPYLT